MSKETSPAPDRPASGYSLAPCERSDVDHPHRPPLPRSELFVSVATTHIAQEEGARDAAVPPPFPSSPNGIIQGLEHQPVHDMTCPRQLFSNYTVTFQTPFPTTTASRALEATFPEYIKSVRVNETVNFGFALQVGTSSQMESKPSGRSMTIRCRRPFRTSHSACVAILCAGSGLGFGVRRSRSRDERPILR